MAKFIGRLVNVGLAKEGTRGSGAVPTWWVPKVSFSFDDKVEKAITEESLGVIEDASEANIVYRWGEGDFEGEVRDQSIGLFLYNLMGSVSSAVDGAAYDHTFTTAATNSHQSLALTIEDDIQDIMFKNLMINSFSLNVELGSIINYTANFMSKSGDDMSSQTASYAGENRFTACHAKVYVDDFASIGTTEYDIKSFNLTVTKNVMRDHVIGTCEPEDLHNQQLQVEGSLTMNLENETWKDFMLNNDYKALRFKAVNTGVDYGGGKYPELQIDLSRVHFYDWQPERPNNELSTQTINFKALYDETNSRNAINQIVLQNDNASY